MKSYACISDNLGGSGASRHAAQPRAAKSLCTLSQPAPLVGCSGLIGSVFTRFAWSEMLDSFRAAAKVTKSVRRCGVATARACA
jgi:hypothetical protein